MKIKSKGKKEKTKVPKTSETDFRNISLIKNVLFKPERYKYIRKQEKVKGCVFCHSSKAISLETLCVYKSKHSMIVLNKFPYNSGHLLVLPPKTSGRYFENVL
jgi:ATP adenylyltransferase/5',5'''-P-1,P-4-tetraphosphate phosphorylase II